MARSCGLIVLGALAACAPDPTKAPAPEVADDPCAVDARAPWDADATAIRVGPDRSFTSVRAALAASISGAALLLDPGTYDEEIITPLDDLTIVGACPEAVRWGTDDGAGPLWTSGARAHIEGITFVGGYFYGLTVTGNDAVLVDVHTVETTGYGLSVVGESAEAHGLDVSGNLCPTPGATLCVAVNISMGSLSVTGGDVHDNDGFGFYLIDGARADLTDVTIRDLHATSGVPNAVAVRVAGTADNPSAALRVHAGTVIRDIEGLAIESTYATISSDGEVEIADTSPQRAGDATLRAIEGALDLGPGLAILRSGSVAIRLDDVEAATLSGVIIEEACATFPDQASAFYASDVGRLTLVDLTVTGAACGGIHAFRTELAGTGGSVDGSHGFGVYVEDGSASLTDLSVTNTGDGDLAGIGVLVSQSTDVVLTNLYVGDNHAYGVLARESALTVDDLVAERNTGAGIALVASVAALSSPLISDTAPLAELDWGGFGVYASRVDSELAEGASYEVPDHDGPELAISGGQISRMAIAGLVVRDGTVAELTGLAVDGTRASDEGGDAVVVAAGAIASLSDVTTTGGARASVLYADATGSVGGSHGDEPAGLVQQGCDGVAPVDSAAQDNAAFSGGVHLCEPSWTSLPVPAVALPWTTHIPL